MPMKHYFSQVFRPPKAGTITGERANRLATAIVTTLRAAIEDGGTSLRDHVQPGGEIGYFVQRLAVYGQAGKPAPGAFADKNHHSIRTFQFLLFSLPTLGL